ncbi:MAG: hypothetical protein JHC26_09035 [Thermofilum sp.]|jgi:hypothetical protein|uniref:hypothetical protein n=1 Tax=Thermofilum sp. TaxID=1961369 RepID=UPI00258EEF67|nr:hypothetical protein [Thermofilum sp.]MCI4409223.1 hypothetical protein [Thermofilum sp.]
MPIHIPQGLTIGYITTQATKYGNPAQSTTSTSYVDILSIDLSTLPIPAVKGIILVKGTGSFAKRSTGTGNVRIAILDSSNNVIASAEYSFTSNGFGLSQILPWEGSLSSARYIKLQFKTNDTDIADCYGYTNSPLALYVKVFPNISFS